MRSSIDRENLQQKVAIIAGINGDLGKAFADIFVPTTYVVGIGRSERTESEHHQYLQLDLLDAQAVQNVIPYIPPSHETLYFHCIGGFKFDDGIHRSAELSDDDVFATSVTPFDNIIPSLLGRISESESSRLTVVAIGGALDPFHLPYFAADIAAVNALRQRFLLIHGNPFPGRVNTLIINISSVDSEQLRIERPYHSGEYLLSPTDVARAGMNIIATQRKPYSIETTVIRPNPHFTLDSERIRQEWYRGMGVDG